MTRTTSSIEIRVLEGAQKGRKMWIGAIKAKDLLNENQVGTDIYDETDNPEGYQRTLSSRRAQDFQRFIEEPRMFSPTTILLNIRGNEIKNVSFENNKMTVKPGTKLWIVDGQHRVGGIHALLESREDADFQNMDVPVIVINVPSKFEEAILFAIFNKTQAGVRYDLVERVLNEQIKKGNGTVEDLRKWYDKAGIKIFKEIDTRLDATDISMVLNRTTDNPWYNNIVAPNENRSTASGKIIRARSFTTSLQPLVKDMRKLKADVDNDAIVAHLIAFWGALKHIMPDAFANPKDYVLQKSTGAAVMHELYIKILNTVTGSLDTPTKASLEKGLEDIKKYIGTDVQKNFLNADYWDRISGRAGMAGTSRKSFDTLEREISEMLDSYVASKKKRVA